MSKTQCVIYGDRDFWAYDVGLGILLKHLIDVAEQLARDPAHAWFREAADQWWVDSIVCDLVLIIEEDSTTSQLNTIVEALHEAHKVLRKRASITAEEMQNWRVLGGEGVFPRGAEVFPTESVVELGEAIIALINGSLPEPPPGAYWIYGTESGRSLGWRSLQNTTPLYVWLRSKLAIADVAKIYLDRGWTHYYSDSNGTVVRNEVSRLDVMIQEGQIAIVGDVSDLEMNMSTVLKALERAEIRFEAVTLDAEGHVVQKWTNPSAQNP